MPHLAVRAPLFFAMSLLNSLFRTIVPSVGRQGAISAAEQIGSIPPQVQNLPRREREVAIIIYLEGSMTAKLLEARLPRELSNSALRCMLARLCRKGILKRRKINGSHLTSDRRIPYVYSPAITPDAVRKRALDELARDYFDGSLLLVAQVLAESLTDKPSRILGRYGPPRGSDRGGIDIAA